MPSNMPDARAVNEALRRAREMQTRSAAPQPPPATPQAPPKAEPEAPVTQQTEPPLSPAAPQKAPSPLDFLLQDKERTLILSLLLLLSTEKNGAELLFVLLYLLI